MTFRAKPVVKRDHRPSWESQDRRNFYLNLGFGIIVVPAILILAHRGRARPTTTTTSRRSAASTASRISKDEFSDRVQDRDLASRRGRPPDPHR